MSDSRRVEKLSDGELTCIAMAAYTRGRTARPVSPSRKGRQL